MSSSVEHTNEQFRKELQKCRDIFSAKLRDYGASWRILRASSVTDQILIKARRIRNLELGREAMVDEGIYPEFQGIVNYGVVGLIQLELGFAEQEDMTAEQALAHYDRHVAQALELMVRKNHDYNEAWRQMRVSTYTDFILTRVQRVKEMEGNGGEARVSEGIDANYLDIMNYAVFGLIKLTEQADGN